MLGIIPSHTTILTPRNCRWGKVVVWGGGSVRGGGRGVRIGGRFIGMDFLALNVLVSLDISSVMTGARGWQLERFDCEGEVLVVRVVHQEPVINGLLYTLSIIAGRYQWTGLSRGITLLYPGGLGEGLVVSLDTVHYDSPFSSCVHCS